MAPTSSTAGVIDTDILIDATKGIADAVRLLAVQQNAGIQLSIISAIFFKYTERGTTAIAVHRRDGLRCSI